MNEIFSFFHDIILEIVFEDQIIRKGLRLYSAKVLLVDGTHLRITEKFLNSQLIKYSYYWLDESNDIIIGWDNAPHHPDLETHPHHKHIQDRTKVLPSQERNLRDTLSFIQKSIRKIR